MNKNGFSSRGLLGVLFVGLIAVMIVAGGISVLLKAESAKSREGPAYQITTLWEDEGSGYAQFYVKALAGDSDAGYISYLSQAVREIRAKGYEDKIIIPASYDGTLSISKVKSIWVVAERKK